MRRYLLATLGASDVQFGDGKRIEHFSQECRELYEMYASSPENGSELASLIDFAILRPLFDKLNEEGKRIDRLLLIYTRQAPEHKQDTYWAYQLIKYVAEQTEYFPYRFEVDGIHAEGDPSDLEAMYSLYTKVCTQRQFEQWGVRREDALYACFTGGTPAMQSNLMQAFSSLQYPAERDYYYVPKQQSGRPAPVRKIRIAELLRHDDLMALLGQLLRSRQFPAALEILHKLEFESLRPVKADAVAFVSAMQQRFLFCFEESDRLLGQCRPELSGTPFYLEMRQQVRGLKEGERRLDGYHPDWLRDSAIQRVVAEYYHKVVFYWSRELWNDYIVAASSFFEWLLRAQFIGEVGVDYARDKPEKKLWSRYMTEQPHPSPSYDAAPIKRRFSFDDVTDRLFVFEALRQWRSDLDVAGTWGAQMDELYKLRNHGVHRLQGTNRHEVHSKVGANWPDAARSVLRKDNGIDTGADPLDRIIDSFIGYLHDRCDRYFA